MTKSNWLHFFGCRNWGEKSSFPARACSRDVPSVRFLLLFVRTLTRRWKPEGAANIAQRCSKQRKSLKKKNQFEKWQLSLWSDVRVKTCLVHSPPLTRVWSSCCALQLLLTRRLNIPPPPEYLRWWCFLAAFEQNTKHLTQRSLFLLTPPSQRMQDRLLQISSWTWTINKSQTAERGSRPPELSRFQDVSLQDSEQASLSSQINFLCLNQQKLCKR